MGYPQPCRDPENLGTWMWARDTGRRHARHLRGYYGHEQRRRQRVTSGRNVSSHGIERPYDLSQSSPAWIIRTTLLGKLRPRVLPDICRGHGDRALELGRHFSLNGNTNACAIKAVKLARILE